MPEEKVDVDLTHLEEPTEEPAEESVEESKVDEEEESETSLEDVEETSEEETETEDWDEYRKQYDLPDTIDSPEKLAESHGESLREMKRAQTSAQTATQRMEQVDALLKSQGIHGGIDSLLSGQAPVAQPQQVASQPQGGQTYFQPNQAKGVVDTMISEGGIAENARESFRGIAKVIDRAITPQFELAEKVMTTAMQQISMMRNQMQGMQWQSLDPQMQGVVDRTEADKLINQGLVSDYAEAARWIAFKNGNVLQTVSDKAEERGRTKAKKKFRKSKALRKGKGSGSSERFDYAQYQDGDGGWNTQKLLASGKGDKILETWEKEHGNKK